MKSLYIIIGVGLLLLTACGQQQQAKSMAKDFIESHISKDVSYVEFSDIDSTKAISDSVLQALQQRGPQGVQYQQRSGQTLRLIRAKYVLNDDTCSATVYFDADMKGVVAVKEN